jgi:hypothetical protein
MVSINTSLNLANLLRTKVGGGINLADTSSAQANKSHGDKIAINPKDANALNFGAGLELSIQARKELLLKIKALKIQDREKYDGAFHCLLEALITQEYQLSPNNVGAIAEEVVAQMRTDKELVDLMQRASKELIRAANTTQS